MTWTKLGDELARAARRLSDAAFRTHTEALMWSNAQGLDLVIPRGDLPRFAYSDRAAQACAELVAAGWWQDRGDTWFIGVQFAEWQEDASDVDRRRQLAAERTRRWRKHRLGDHSLCDSRHCDAAPRNGALGYPQVGVTRDVTHHPTRDVTRHNEFPQVSGAVTRDVTRDVTPPRTVPSRPDPSRPARDGSGTEIGRADAPGYADAQRRPRPEHWPPWCGRCDPATSQTEDEQERPRRCPDCHPMNPARRP